MLQQQSSFDRNPLSLTVLVLVIFHVLPARQALIVRQIDLLSIVLLVQAVVLLALYLKRSKHAGWFMVWSIALLVPLYFVSVWARQGAGNVSLATLAVVGLFWLGGLVLGVRLSRAYTAFLVARALRAI